VIPHIVMAATSFSSSSPIRARSKLSAAGGRGADLHAGRGQGNFSQAVNGGPDPNVVVFPAQANPYYQPNPTLAAQGIINPTPASIR
jgi:hypothetical protein